MVKVAVVVVEEEFPPIRTVGCVWSQAGQDQPVPAASPVAPAMVITAEQLTAPRVKVPAAEPPEVAEIEQPEVVILVPLSIRPVPRRILLPWRVVVEVEFVSPRVTTAWLVPELVAWRYLTGVAPSPMEKKSELVPMK